MFKQYPSRDKVIAIKSVDYFEQHAVDETTSPDDRLTLAQYKLDKVKNELKAAEQQKDQLLQNTIAEIDMAKQSWESEKEILKESVTEKAYKDGLERGKQAGLATYEQQLNEANSITNLAKENYNKLLDESEQTIAQLAVHIANKIMKQSLKKEPEQYLSIVKAAITEIKDQSVISIYLHPANYKAVMEQKKELQNVLHGDTELSVYIDQSLEENSCIIEHPLGQIDASIDTQLKEIRSVLIDVAKEHQL